MTLSEHLEKIRHFVALSKYGTISETSRIIHITQAGLSKSVSNLEGILNVKLFDRSQRGLSLTSEGKALLETSHQIQNAVSAYEVSLAKRQKMTAPTKLSVGMYDSIAVYFYKFLAETLNQVFPELKLALTIDHSCNLIELVKEQKLDIALVAGVSNLALNGYKVVSMFSDQYSCYASPNSKHAIEHSAILLHPEAKDDCGNSVENSLKIHFESSQFHRILNFETVRALTVQGAGLGVLPTKVAAPFVTLGDLVQVTLPNLPKCFGLHQISYFSKRTFCHEHPEFIEYLVRLGHEWSKS
jgi:DNA-binding transcriptional LysR family regulator